jgi:hypothetical protein
MKLHVDRLNAWNFKSGVNPKSVEEKTAFDRITPAHIFKEQDFGASCAATCLVIGALELGEKKIAVMEGSYAEITGRDTLSLDKECEADVFKVCGNCASYDEEDLEDVDESLPHNICIAAKLVGMDVQVYEGERSEALPRYSVLKKELENHGINVESKSHVVPGEGEREMKLLILSDGRGKDNLHWVLSRPDGTFMDPGNGKNAIDFEHLKENLREKPKFSKAEYQLTDVSIMLKKADIG